jgi:hypothetical protein
VSIHTDYSQPSPKYPTSQGTKQVITYFDRFYGFQGSLVKNVGKIFKPIKNRDEAICHLIPLCFDPVPTTIHYMTECPRANPAVSMPNTKKGWALA